MTSLWWNSDESEWLHLRTFLLHYAVNLLLKSEFPLTTVFEDSNQKKQVKNKTKQTILLLVGKGMEFRMPCFNHVKSFGNCLRFYKVIFYSLPFQDTFMEFFPPRIHCLKYSKDHVSLYFLGQCLWVWMIFKGYSLQF